MKKFIRLKKYAIISFLGSVLIILGYLYIMLVADYDLSVEFIGNTLAPIVVISAGAALISFFFFFFSKDIFKSWLKYIAWWYVLLALLFIVSGSTGSSYTWPSRVDFAGLFGSVLVIITFVFALIQKFKYKR